jgi:hypothetical protein
MSSNGNNEPPVLVYRNELESVEIFLKQTMEKMDDFLKRVAPRCVFFIIGGHSLYQYYNPIVLGYPYLKTNDIDFQIVTNGDNTQLVKGDTTLSTINHFLNSSDNNLTYTINGIEYLIKSVKDETYTVGTTEFNLRDRLQITNTVWNPSSRILYESDALDFMITNNNSSVDIYIKYQQSLGKDVSDLNKLLKPTSDSLYPTKEFVDFNIMYMFGLLLLLLFEGKQSRKYVKSAKILGRMFLVFNKPEDLHDERDDLVTVFSRSIQNIHDSINDQTSIRGVMRETDRIIRKILEIIKLKTQSELKNQLHFILDNIRDVAYEFNQQGGGIGDKKSIFKNDFEFIKELFPKDLLVSSEEEVEKYSYNEIINQTIIEVTKPLLSSFIKPHSNSKPSSADSIFTPHATFVTVGAVGGYRKTNKSKLKSKKNKVTKKIRIRSKKFLKNKSKNKK